MTDWLNRCHFGDVRDVLRQMIAAGVKVNCIVTSPPYWGLRSYLPADHPDKAHEIGSEPTLQEFIQTMTGVFDLARQVLADDGTLWMNMGDSYANDGKWGGMTGGKQAYLPDDNLLRVGREKKNTGLKPKDLMGQPWRLAFALQDAGWWLRQDIVWHKPNPMPESIRDRCTKSHEYIFHLSKSEKYYFDQDAILEPVSLATHARLSQNVQAQIGSERAYGGAKANGNMKAVGRREGPPGNPAEGVPPKAALVDTENAGAYADGKSERMGRGAGWRKAYAGNGVGFGHGYDESPKPRVKNNESFDAAMAIMPTHRNKRSVWTVNTESYKGAHFATFPRKLIEPCILAGCPPGGTVLDIFMGSGTTAQVAEQLGRKWIGIDIDRRNEALQRERLRQPSLELEAA